EPGSGENAEKDKSGSGEGEKGKDRAGSAIRFFLIFSSKERGINGNERGGENAFAEEILEEIGDADGGFESVGGVGIAEIMGEEAIANQSGDAAKKNSGGDQKSRTGGAEPARGGRAARGG
ncbi:MAG: hypothetical protein WCA98_16140, partial [Candidatus Acidiferrales bacterium]